MTRLGLKIGPATRDAYGRVLAELGATHPEIVVLDADLSKSTRASVFAEAYPDRFFNVGICEANMVGIASGLAACGKLPFVSSFASFLVCKSYDQVRMGIAVPHLRVNLVGSHSGITLGEDGVSQMAIEDIALMTSLPGFTVIAPADDPSTAALVRQMADHPHPIYLRTGRSKTAIVYTGPREFRIGKAEVLRDGTDVAIVACGIEVAESLEAAAELEAEGVSAAVIDMHTIKPLDEETLAAYALKCGAVVTAEEHQAWGGLGAAVAQALGRRAPAVLESVALADTYAKSGAPEKLKEAYGLTAPFIAAAARRAVARKK